MSDSLKYAILAGPVKRPETVQVGVLEKGSGQTIITGESVNMMAKRGQIGIPNWTQAWAVRLDKDGKVPKDPIDVRDSNYRGQIKELPWGVPGEKEGETGGCLIDCRYLKGYGSIDRLYQDNILNAAAYIKNTEDTEAAADVFMLFLQSGDSYFDSETDRHLCQMLRIHYLNASSKSKDPSYENYQFRDLESSVTSEKDMKSLDDTYEAIKIVKDASNDNSLQQLKNLYLIMDGLAEMGLKDGELYPSLFALAQARSKLFLDKIMEYKKNVSMTFQLLKSYEAIDFTRKGVIAAGVKEKIVVFDGVPAKGEDGVIEWVLTNFLSADSTDIAIKLKKIADDITKTK